MIDEWGGEGMGEVMGVVSVTSVALNNFYIASEPCRKLPTGARGHDIKKK